MKLSVHFLVYQSQTANLYVFIDDADDSCSRQHIFGRVCHQSDAPPFITNS